MTPVSTILRYWHTLRYLKPVQFYRRAWFQLATPRPDQSIAPLRRSVDGNWHRPAARFSSLVGPREFLFLNTTGKLAEIGWDDPRRTKLWRYNQHYFDDLNAEAAADRQNWHQDLIAQWIAGNSPARGSGWEPYPTSLRIVNWIKWSLSGNTLSAKAHHSLAIQARWLCKRLEWHLLGNHLFANAKALLFAGFYFNGPEGAKFRQISLDILEKELPEQILEDGGQFELTPMYHAIALEDVLDILNLLNAFPTASSARETELKRQCTAFLPAMLRWHETMAHPDGDISFFNDAAFGIAPPTSELYRLAVDLGFDRPVVPQGLTHLPSSGYLRLQTGRVVLLADVAPVGPDYLPGHAHADTLSFEMSLGQQRVFVNSGTSVYGLCAERVRQRGTAAHNTVVVDGADSSEVWGGFRVARRARISDVQTEITSVALQAEASHDGYCRLPNGPTHWRSWTLKPFGLEITDRLSTKRLAQARYHLHPDVQATLDTSATGKLKLPNGSEISWACTGAEATLERTSWHPSFGADLANTCLVLTFANASATLALEWD